MKNPRILTLLSLVVAASIVMLTWTQRWFTITLQDGVTVDVLGSDSAKSLAALALAIFALVAALSISTVFLRRILGAVALAVAVLIIVVSQSTLTAPAQASSELVTQVTGISGVESIQTLVVSIDTTAWPYCAIGTAVLLIAVSLAIILSAHRWPVVTKKYDRTVAVVTDDPASQWDAQSQGFDPSER